MPGRRIAELKMQVLFIDNKFALIKQWTTVPLMGATSVENWCSARTNNVRPAQPTYARLQPSSMVPAVHRSLYNGRQASLAGISVAALLIEAHPNNNQYRVVGHPLMLCACPVGRSKKKFQIAMRLGYHRAIETRLVRNELPGD